MIGMVMVVIAGRAAIVCFDCPAPMAPAVPSRGCRCLMIPASSEYWGMLMSLLANVIY